MRLDDLTYLRNQQYRDGGNLSARVALHRRFSTNQTGWFPWVFDRLSPPDEARILELGCGTWALWLENRTRILQNWDVTLSDLSPGMVGETRTRLRDASVAAHPCVADAQHLLFRDATFDAALANHMLYHVPDRPRALAEIARVLRPGGRFLAATNGRNHLRKLDALAARFGMAMAMNDAADHFGIENGAAQLQPWFAEVTYESYPDELEISEVEPVVAYLRSAPGAKALNDSRIAVLREEIAAIIARAGAFRVTKASGLFRCRVLR